MSINPGKQEFIDLWEVSGWSQAETARRLNVERATVNGIVTGPHTPSMALVKLLRLVLKQEAAPDVAAAVGAIPEAKAVAAGLVPPRPVILPEDSPEIRSATVKLRELLKRSPAAFQTVENVILTYHRSLRRRRTVDPSSLTSAEQKASSADVAEELEAAQAGASKPSPSAASPTSRKGARGRGTGKR